MLATVMWETTCPTLVEHVALNRKGQPLKDKLGQPLLAGGCPRAAACWW